MRITALVALGMLHIGCSSYDMPIPPGTCYNIVMAAWPESADYGADSVQAAPPPRVRLDTMNMLPYDSASGVISEVPGVLPSIHHRAVWRYRPPDSVLMSWSDGYGGVVLRLRGSAESLTGEAESFFDYRDGDRVDARAERVDCSATVPVDHRAMPWFHVEMASGVLQIASPPPESIRLDSIGLRRFKTDEAPVRAFSGADSVLVDLTEGGLVRGISLHYPDVVDLEDLTSRVEPFLGPPNVSDMPSMNDALETLGWVNRYYTASASGPPNAHIFVSAIRTPR